MSQKLMRDYIKDIQPIVMKNTIIKIKKRKYQKKILHKQLENDEFKKFENALIYTGEKNNLIGKITRKRKRSFRIKKSIDLHGLTRETAYLKLVHFFYECICNGICEVLVITGGNKLKESVLRTSFQQWLVESLGKYVTSCSESELRHGGEGAFYVVLKKSTIR